MIGFSMKEIAFIPAASAPSEIQVDAIYVTPEELEALRLVYYEGLSQEEAANRMGISRGTLWRALDSGRKKIIKALIEQKAIILVS
jgi:hypothetical protein